MTNKYESHWLKARFMQSIFILSTLFLLGALPYWLGPGISAPSPIGPYFNNQFPSLTPNSMGGMNVTYTIENAFPNLTFVDPVDMVELPNNRILVIGKPGLAWIFEDNSSTMSKTLAFDNSAHTILSGDSGLLGVALHPEFGQMGSPNREYLYIWYRYTPISGSEGDNGYMRLSRLNLPAGSNTIDLNTEEVLIQIFDRHDWHNGGGMFFGPDGFLYLTIGDEGGANDYSNVSQQIDKWMFGGIIRIDVDKKGGSVSHPIIKQPETHVALPSGSEWVPSYTREYYIPDDNPWVDPTGNTLEEFFSIGLRSPHRMTYDAVTGDMWIGDIGQSSREEISRVNRNTILTSGVGANMQWPYKEGNINGAKAKPANVIGTEMPPAFDYPRSFGRCVIGGLVVRGSTYPELDGKYIFADHEVQNIWTLENMNGNWEETFLLNVPVEGSGGKDGVSSFKQANDGTIYILDLFGTGLDGGKIHKLIRQDGSIPDPPALLSQVGAFTDLVNLTPASGMIPYTVNAPLWSDRAVKKRWIALPNDGSYNTPPEQITFDDELNWKFPPGTVMVKHFELPVDENNPNLTTRLETRFVVFDEAGGAYGVTYRWNEAGTDATLLTQEETRDIIVTKMDGSQFTQTWEFPNRQQCMDCHNGAVGYALGINTRQINADFLYPGTGITANQLETWNYLGMFDKDLNTPNQYPQSADLWDENTSEEFRIRSYLDANCSFCHHPNGVNAVFDARSLTALHDQMMINATVISDGSPPGGLVITPQNPSQSVMYNRDNSLGNDAMPPLAKNLLDDDYISALGEWINGLDANPPSLITESWYEIKARHSNLLLSVFDGHTYENANVVQTTDINTSEQQWYAQNMGAGKYALINRASNLVIALEHFNAGNETQLVQQVWQGKQSQLWYFELAEGNYYHIKSAYNGLNIGVKDGASAQNALIHSELPDPAIFSQQFELNTISGSAVSVNESNCFGTNAIQDPLPQCRYTVKYVDSEELNGNSGAVSKAFDGNPNSIWHTEWQAQSPVHPHEVQFDLGNVFQVNALKYLPRQDASYNGTIKDYEVYLSIDGLNWGNPVAAGTWATTKTQKTASFTPSIAQFVRLVALNEVNGNPWTSAAEIEVESSWCMDNFQPIGETGKLSVDYNWQTVVLDNTYNNPVVIPSSASYNDEEDVTVRIRNVTNTSFDIRLEEWDCSSVQNHDFESIDYLVVEAGVHKLIDGSTIMAGKAHDVDHNWTTIPFAKPFVNNPIFFAHCLSINESERVVTRIEHNQSNKTQMRVKLQEDSNSSNHAGETIGWIAVEPSTYSGNFSFESGSTGRIVDENWEPLTFNQCYANPVFIDNLSSNYGGDPSGLRHQNLSENGIEVVVEEETCSDSEVGHTDEAVHFWVFNGPGNLYGKTMSIVYAKVLLQGAINGASMNTTLADNNLLPLSHPYNTAPWNYNGNECVTSFPDNVVDWVLVNICHPNDPTKIMEQRACFVKQDGTLIDIDGAEGVFFGKTAVNTGYLSIHHRNHLAIMTKSVVGLN